MSPAMPSPDRPLRDRLGEALYHQKYAFIPLGVWMDPTWLSEPEHEVFRLRADCFIELARSCGVKMVVDE